MFTVIVPISGTLRGTVSSDSPKDRRISKPLWFLDFS